MDLTDTQLAAVRDAFDNENARRVLGPRVVVLA